MASALQSPTRSPVGSRPPWLNGLIGGVTAAGVGLAICGLVGLVGWFLSDAGAHGGPVQALGVSTAGWLLGHGSGLTVKNAEITVMPLGITLLAGWICWRVGHRVGAQVSGHGPDADQLADGARDWTPLLATGAFSAGYAGLALTAGTWVNAARADAEISLAGVFWWSLLLTWVCAGPAIAISSGRAAQWALRAGADVRASAAGSLVILLGFGCFSTAALLGALIADFSTASNLLGALRTSPGEGLLFTLLSLLLLPNAILFTGAYLLGPGFMVGKATLVTPQLVVLGPLPSFPLLAALPDEGSGGWWSWVLMLGPYAVAAVAAALNQVRHPTASWTAAALRGACGGVLAGLAVGLLSYLAGGAAGPGRMSAVEIFALQAMTHAIVAFGVGGALGALAATWWHRRRAGTTSVGEAS